MMVEREKKQGLFKIELIGGEGKKEERTDITSMFRGGAWQKIKTRPILRARK